MTASSTTGRGTGSAEGPIRGLGPLTKVLQQTQDIPAFDIDGNKIRSKGGSGSGDLAAHIADTGNPHDTTALQVGADALGSAAAVQQNLINHETDILIHFSESSIDHDNIQNNGVNTHSQIDYHLSDVDNPHLVDLEQARLQGNVIGGPIDANGNTIANLPVPVANSDAATKSYVDGIATGLKLLDSVRVGTTANLTATYNPLNLRLTASGNGAISIDNVALVQTNI